MTTNSPVADEAGQIRTIVETWVKAVRARDAGAAVGLYSPDVLLFDIAPPLQHRGAAALRKELDTWFASFRGPLGYEIRDLNVAAGGDLAIAHGLVHLTGDRTDGSHTDVWMRSTIGLQRVGGSWRIVHEHTSVPLYMDGSNRAAVDLKP